MLKKICTVCGKEYEVSDRQGNSKYCSDTCRSSFNKTRIAEYGKRYYREHYRRQPKETKCRRCGSTFLGRWNQAYCPDCLSDSSDYRMKQYRAWRKEDPCGAKKSD